MSHLSPGLISAYNSLTDRHLAGYFSSTRIRRHLQRAGLITRSGRIVPDKEYRLKLIQRAHQRHVRECLAQAIFHKVLEMERLHQIEIKRKLEEFSRRERVHKIKVERSRRYEEDIHILSPRPPTCARAVRKQNSGPEGDHSESSESPGSSRPNTAPGKMQRPVRLKPIHNHNTTASLRRSSPYRLHGSSNENDRPFNCTIEKESRRHFTKKDASRGISPYCLPVINNFVTPVPPATKRKERGVKVAPSSTLRGRRLRPATASSGADINEEPPILRSSAYQSRVRVNMVYFGKAVHLSHDLADMTDEIKVFQQHCGGENLCVYKGKLREGEMFQFISRRHRGFPFSLTFFLNGLQVERLSSCCEFKHRKGSRLGGRHGHFGFSGIERASPCYRCIIAMGLDKKPTPPPKRYKEEEISPKDTEMEAERTRGEAASHSECETTMGTPVKEETAHEDKLRDDYEEDFEADDEGAAEDSDPREKKSMSPSSDTERVKDGEASEIEDDEKDEDTRSRSSSSSAGSDSEESEAEAAKDSREEEEAEQPKEVNQEEDGATPDKQEESNLGEVTVTEAEPALTKDADVEVGTEIQVTDTSLPSGSENTKTDDASEQKEDEKTVEESKQTEEQETVRSVHEELADVLLKEPLCSSEPERSDTIAEEQEPTDEGHKLDIEDAVPLESETKCEEIVAGAAEGVQEHEEISEPKEQEEESDECPQKTSQNDLDEKEEEVGKATPEEDEGRADKSEDSEDPGAATHPVVEEEKAEDDKPSEPQDDAADKSTDAEAAEKGEESEEKTAVEADKQAGRGAETSKEDESDEKTDETTVPDNADEEAMPASETEMKAEHSEEREALSCEEAPVTDAERQQEDDEEEDIAAGSQTEVTAEKESSSSEGSGDTTVQAEKTADTNVDDGGKDEISKDDEEEEVSGADAVKGESENQTCGRGEETTEVLEETNNEVEKEKPEEESKEEEEETNPDELSGENTEDREVETSKTEEEENTNKEDEVKCDENIVEETKTDSNVDSNKEEDKSANEYKADESGTADKDDGDNVVGECLKSKDDEEESEEKGDDTNKDEEVHGTTTDVVPENGDEAEETKKAENDDEVEDEKNKDDEEKEIISSEMVEGQEMSEVTEQPEEISDKEKDHLKTSDESIIEDVSEELLHKLIDTEKESDTGERGEVDAESGEMSTRAEGQTDEDNNNDGGRSEQNGEERKAEQAEDDERLEVEEETEGGGDVAEKHEDDGVEQAPPTAEVESDAEEGEATEEDNGETDKKDFEIKEESKPDDVNTSGGESEVVHSGDPAQVTASSIDLDDTAHKLDNKESDWKSDDRPHTDGNAADADLSAAGEETAAEMEEASKASEEGASVLLKPQAQPAQDEADKREDTMFSETPEALAKEDSADLVINWVNIHQASKLFETFVEPLEELRDSTSDAQVSDTELLRSVSLSKMVKMSEGEADGGNEHTPKDVNEEEEGEEECRTKVEAVQSEPERDQPAEPCEEDTLQEEEEEVKHLIPNTEEELHVMDAVTELTKKEESEESNGSLEERKDQEGPTAVFKTEVESIAGSDQSGVNEVKEDELLTAAEEIKDQEHSDNPEGMSELSSADMKADEPKPAEGTWEKTDEASREVTEITYFTASKSDDGSQEESLKPSDGSVSADKGDEQPSQDITHTVSRDQMSFSAGRSSYSLLAAARTESGQ